MGHTCSPEGLQGCKVFSDLLYLSFQWMIFKYFLVSCARHYQSRDEEDTVLLRRRSQVEGAPCLRRLGGTLQKTGTGADLEDRLRICQQDKHLLCESQSMGAARAPQSQGIGSATSSPGGLMGLSSSLQWVWALFWGLLGRSHFLAHSGWGEAGAQVVRLRSSPPFCCWLGSQRTPCSPWLSHLLLSLLLQQARTSCAAGL